MLRANNTKQPLLKHYATIYLTYYYYIKIVFPKDISDYCLKITSKFFSKIWKRRWLKADCTEEKNGHYKGNTQQWVKEKITENHRI